MICNGFPLIKHMFVGKYFVFLLSFMKLLIVFSIFKDRNIFSGIKYLILTCVSNISPYLNISKKEPTYIEEQRLEQTIYPFDLIKIRKYIA